MGEYKDEDTREWTGIFIYFITSSSLIHIEKKRRDEDFPDHMHMYGNVDTQVTIINTSSCAWGGEGGGLVCVCSVCLYLFICLVFWGGHGQTEKMDTNAVTETREYSRSSFDII
jgi:hypothetical protein